MLKLVFAHREQFFVNFQHCRVMSTQNWAENVIFANKSFLTPETMQELQEVVANSSSLRVLGSGHSFSPVCDTEGTLVSLAFMRNILELNTDNMTVSMEGGATLGDVVRYLSPRGAALKNVPSLPHVSIAGALATGTHGTGLYAGRESGLPSMCREIEFITHDGSQVVYDRDHPNFSASVVHLGALGVVSRVVLDIVPAFEAEQRVYTSCNTSAIINNYREVASSADSVTIDFNFGTGESVVWQRFFELDEELGGVAGILAPPLRQSLGELGGILALKPKPFFELGAQHPGVATTRKGPWHDVLSYFMEGGRDLNMPHVALQSEYFVPLEQASKALSAVQAMASAWPAWMDTVFDERAYPHGPLVFHCETRVVPRDGLGGLCQFGDRDSLAIHFTWTGEGQMYREQLGKVIEELEATLLPYSARPHWGKLNNFTQQQVASVYPHEALDNFRKVMLAHDPHGKFVNDLVLRQIVG